MIERETIVYVVMPKRAEPVPPPAEVPKPEVSFPFGKLFLLAIALLIAWGIGATNNTHVPSPANPPVGPTPSGIPGIAAPEIPSTQTPP